MSTLPLLIRLVLRRLASRPAWTALVASTLALGVGANLAVYSVVRGVLLEPLPYAAPEQLVTVREASTIATNVPLTQAELEGIRSGSRALAQIEALDRVSFNLRDREGAEQVAGALVSERFFELFGLSPALGRTLTADDYQLVEQMPVVISDALWRVRYGADPSIVGRQLTLAWTASFGPPRRLPESFVVVGVLRPDFRSPFGSADIVAPLIRTEGNARQQANYLFGFARLADRATPQSAEAELDRLLPQLGAETLPPWLEPAEVGATVISLREGLVGRVEAALWVLFAAVSLVLVIACANVASLLLTRFGERRTELALQSALGASHGRLAGALLLESTFLVLLGTVLGTIVARGVLVWLTRFGGGVLPRLEHVQLDWRAASFGLVLAVATVLMVGAAPSLAVSRSLFGRRWGRGAGRLGAVLVSVEVALAIVLLVAAGLLGRSFRQLVDVDLGFRTERLVTFDVALPRSRYSDPEERRALVRRVLGTIGRLPAVESVSASRGVPLDSLNVVSGVTVSGYESPDGRRASSSYRLVSTDYFVALGVPLIRGRTFRPEDLDSAARVVVVNEAFVRRFYGGREPLGGSVTVHSEELEDARIVGVVGDVHVGGPVRDPRPTVFVPSLALRSAAFAVRIGSGSPEALLDDLRRAVTAVDPALPAHRFVTYDTLASRRLGRPFLNTVLMGSFALLALALAGLSVFGAVSQAVRQRSRELGVRQAMGASPPALIATVVSRALTPVAIGAAVGVALAAVLSHLLRAVLFGIQPLDPWAFSAALGTMVAATLAALIVPTRRITRLDPMRVLREE